MGTNISRRTTVFQLPYKGPQKIERAFFCARQFVPHEVSVPVIASTLAGGIDLDLRHRAQCAGDGAAEKPGAAAASALLL